MNTPDWFEKKPSKEFKGRVEHTADQEIDRRSRLKDHAVDEGVRRGFLSYFSFEVVGSATVAVVAGVLGFWLVNRDEHVPVELADASLEPDDIELIADLEFMEEFDILESLKEEDMSS